MTRIVSQRHKKKKISVNIMFLLTTFKESAEHVSLRLADICLI